MTTLAPCAVQCATSLNVSMPMYFPSKVICHTPESPLASFSIQHSYYIQTLKCRLINTTFSIFLHTSQTDQLMVADTNSFNNDTPPLSSPSLNLNTDISMIVLFSLKTYQLLCYFTLSSATFFLYCNLQVPNKWHSEGVYCEHHTLQIWGCVSSFLIQCQLPP